ncbi:hypothetical protein DPMN_038287 [Dreissena polymorpha]|uniref:DNA 3'-5' helicase n=1 Tax=Dreissena polymorpha TaxID=45954 RepID=A0A9D4ME01_DREPO|nr:hypothetical protein DPMN_038287 [Dreissena polymorpha]
MASFEHCVKVSLTKLKANIELEQQQLDVLRAVFDGKDTIAVLPTDFGKSLLFQMLPYLMAEKFGKSKPMIVIVIAPINAIMEEQVRELRAKGIMACSLSYSGSGATTFDAEEDMEDTDCDDKVILPKEVTMKELMDGKYHIIYTHPECLFQSKAIAKMIRSKHYQEHLCGIVIDEVHMILEWQNSNHTPHFGNNGLGNGVKCSFC